MKQRSFQARLAGKHYETKAPTYPGENTSLDQITNYKERKDSNIEEKLNRRGTEDLYSAETIWCAFICDVSSTKLGKIYRNRLLKFHKAVKHRALYEISKIGTNNRRNLSNDGTIIHSL